MQAVSALVGHSYLERLPINAGEKLPHLFILTETRRGTDFICTKSKNRGAAPHCWQQEERYTRGCWAGKGLEGGFHSGTPL